MYIFIIGEKTPPTTTPYTVLLQKFCLNNQGFISSTYFLQISFSIFLSNLLMSTFSQASECSRLSIWPKRRTLRLRAYQWSQAPSTATQPTGSIKMPSSVSLQCKFTAPICTLPCWYQTWYLNFFNFFIYSRVRKSKPAKKFSQRLTCHIISSVLFKHI